MKKFNKLFEAEGPSLLTANREEVEKLAAKLTAAFKAGPEATREFLDSEEGKSQTVRELLKKPQVDGVEKDDKVTVTDSPDTPVKELIPTQRFIDLMQSVSFPLSQFESEDKKSGLLPAIQSKKGFGTIVLSESSEGTLIIDGHHRWSGIFGIAPDGKIDAKMVNWPGVNAKEKLAAAQISIAAWKGAGKPLPSKGGEPQFNILGKSAEEITKMILDNSNKPDVVDEKVKGLGGLLNDKMIQDIIANPKVVFEWAGIKEGEKNPEVIRKAIATKVGQNLSQMKNYVEGAPPREDMPQFDDELENPGPKFKTISPDLQAGNINLSPPFVQSDKEANKPEPKPAQAQSNESRYIRTFEQFRNRK